MPYMLDTYCIVLELTYLASMAYVKVMHCQPHEGIDYVSPYIQVRPMHTDAQQTPRNWAGRMEIKVVYV
jgi:hypothetical protein